MGIFDRVKEWIGPKSSPLKEEQLEPTAEELQKRIDSSDQHITALNQTISSGDSDTPRPVVADAVQKRSEQEILNTNLKSELARVQDQVTNPSPEQERINQQIANINQEQINTVKANNPADIGGTIATGGRIDMLENRKQELESQLPSTNVASSQPSQEQSPEKPSQ